MISVTYDSGEVRQFDLQKAPDRVSLIVSLMTSSEMARFFLPGEGIDMAKKLALASNGSEMTICKRIHAHFHNL
jgi:hypothetical protein